MLKYIYFAFVIWCLIYESDNSLIEIKDNGYSGIVVGFSRKIETDNKKELLQNLKNVFNEASGVLYEITAQRAYFKEITFLIPQSWGEKENWFNPDGKSTLNNIRLERYNEADIFVESGSDFFGNNPYTIQVAGCAKQGLGIHISEAYLRTSGDELNLKARNFVYEWMKYRYGVFDEHGFQGDERYPILHGIPGNSTYKKVTSCSNHPVEYRQIDMKECSINGNTGRLIDPTCAIEIKSELTNDSSSFMFSSKMKNLCGSGGEYAHDYSSPTKHNALCFEYSISEIISRHKDMKDVSSSLVDLTPAFYYVQESSLRLLLAIDHSEDNSGSRMEFLLKKVVNMFLDFSIVKEQPVDLLFYSARNDTLVKSFEDNWSFPDAPDTGPGCIKCALRDSIEILNKYELVEGSILVLIVRHALDDAELKILRDDFDTKNIRVHIILCLADGPTINQLEYEVAETGIRVQYVPLNVENTEYLLYGALQSSVRDDTFDTAEDNIMIMQQSFKDSKSFVDFTFPVDKTAKRELKVLLSSSGSIFEINYMVSIDNKNYAMKDKILKFSFIPGSALSVLEFSPEIEPIGEITMHIKKKNAPVDVVVLAKENSVSSAIIVRCWLSSASQFIKMDGSSEPVVLYAEVRSGNFPVQNARVKAFLHHPDKSVTSYTLTDDGIGDPDITKDDGIYTRYITGFSVKGHYILTVLVTDDGAKTKVITGTGRDNNCCGSFIPSASTQPTGRFKRIYDYGSFYVSLSQNQEDKDFYPPSRITDFKIVHIRDDKEPDWRFYLTFEFSSPGGNYNNDKASRYDIRYFTDRSHVKDFDNGIIPDEYQPHPRLPTPNRYGQKESFILEMPENNLKALKAPNETVFFAIRAVDDGENKGEPSNIVDVYLPIPSPSTKSPTVSSSPNTGEDGNNDGEADRQTDDSQKKMSSGQIGMIVGIVVGCIILLIAVAVVAFIFTRRKNTRKPKESRALSENNKSKKTSNEYLSDDTLKAPTLKAPLSVSDPISPVQSWPANVLMDHYDKVQEAKRKNGSDDSIDSSSGDSSHPLKPNPVYGGGTDDRYTVNDRYLPTAPFTSSQNSINRTPRNVSQV